MTVSLSAFRLGGAPGRDRRCARFGSVCERSDGRPYGAEVPGPGRPGQRAPGLTRPDEDPPVLVRGHAPGQDQLCPEVFEEGIVQPKLPLEAAVGDPPLALEERDRKRHEVEESHGCTGVGLSIVEGAGSRHPAVEDRPPPGPGVPVSISLATIRNHGPEPAQKMTRDGQLALRPPVRGSPGNPGVRAVRSRGA